MCTKGNGVISEKVIAFTDVTKLKTKCSFDVSITQGDEFKVNAKGDENILESLVITEKKRECILHFKSGCYTDYDLEINITMPTISALTLAGSGNIEVDDFVGIDNLNALIDGSGNITFNSLKNINNAELEVNGSGDISFKKPITSVNQINAKIYGSGDIEVYDLACKNAIIDVNVSGNVELKVEDSADISISGSGDVDIQGNPKIIQKVNGSGKVNISE